MIISVHRPTQPQVTVQKNRAVTRIVWIYRSKPANFKADGAGHLLIPSFVIGTKYFLVQWNFYNICFDLPSQKIIAFTQSMTVYFSKLSSHHLRIETENWSEQLGRFWYKKEIHGAMKPWRAKEIFLKY